MTILGLIIVANANAICAGWMVHLKYYGLATACTLISILCAIQALGMRLAP